MKTKVVDRRYDLVRVAWMAGELKSFAQIWDIVPRSVANGDLHMRFDYFSKKLKDPQLFRFKEIRELARLTKVEFRYLLGLVADAIDEVERMNGGAEQPPSAQEAG